MSNGDAADQAALDGSHEVAGLALPLSTLLHPQLHEFGTEPSRFWRIHYCSVIMMFETTASPLVGVKLSSGCPPETSAAKVRVTTVR